MNNILGSPFLLPNHQTSDISHPNFLLLIIKSKFAMSENERTKFVYLEMQMQKTMQLEPLLRNNLRIGGRKQKLFDTYFLYLNDAYTLYRLPPPLRKWFQNIRNLMFHLVRFRAARQ